MEGVTILVTDVVTKTNPVMNTILIVLGVIAVVGFLLLFLGMAPGCDRMLVIGLITLVTAFVMFLIGIPIDCMTQVPDYNTYEVILDDSVSMNKFMSTYEILEQRGQIYVVKEIKE